jgi:3-oxoadipate enol-lactonase
MESQLSGVRLDDGANTTLECWGDRGPVMLCVHGMTGSRLSWLRFARRYEERFRVCAYDQRGHGGSAGVLGPMSLERGVRDLEQVAAAIGGVDILIGHSWGGAIVIRAGLRVPVRAVAAIDPMIVQLNDAWYAEYMDELTQAFLHTGAQRDADTRAECAAWHPDDAEGKVHAVHAMTPEPISRLRTENTASDWDLRAEIARYDRPLLLLMAGRDGSITPAEVRSEVERTRPAQVRIETFEDRGHDLHRTDFDGITAVLDRFLKGSGLNSF